MLDPVALVEMVRRAPAEQLREMGGLFLELADRREGNPDWDANMMRAAQLVREQQLAGTFGVMPVTRDRVSVPVIRRTPAPSPSPDERNH